MFEVQTFAVLQVDVEMIQFCYDPFPTPPIVSRRAMATER